MKPAQTGWIIAVITVILDQGSKLGVMNFFDISVRDILSRAPLVDSFPQGMSYAVTSFFSLTVTWNKGISYGLFQQETAIGRWALALLSLIAVFVLAYWLKSTKRQIVIWSFGMIIGGALGNAWDRVAYGAVFDFAHFHIQDFSWYIFNIADAAIVLGVIGLIFDTFVPERSSLNQEKQ